MKSVKIKLNKRTMLALQIVEAMLREAFTGTVLIGQAEIQWKSLSHEGRDFYHSRRSEATIKGFTRGSIAFECKCVVGLNDIQEWDPLGVEFKIVGFGRDYCPGVSEEHPGRVVTWASTNCSLSNKHGVKFHAVTVKEGDIW